MYSGGGGENSKCCESKENRIREDLISQSNRLKNDIYDLSREYNINLTNRFVDLESILERTKDVFVLQTINRELNSMLTQLRETVHILNEELRKRKEIESIERKESEKKAELQREKEASDRKLIETREFEKEVEKRVERLLWLSVTRDELRGLTRDELRDYAIQQLQEEKMRKVSESQRSSMPNAYRPSLFQGSPNDYIHGHPGKRPFSTDPSRSRPKQSRPNQSRPNQSFQAGPAPEPENDSDDVKYGRPTMAGFKFAYYIEQNNCVQVDPTDPQNTIPGPYYDTREDCEKANGSDKLASITKTRCQQLFTQYGINSRQTLNTTVRHMIQTNHPDLLEILDCKKNYDQYFGSKRKTRKRRRKRII